MKEEIEFTECDSMSQIMRIEVNLPDNHWAGIVTRNNPQSILQIIETMPLSRGRGTAQIICDKEIMAALSSTKGVESLQTLSEDRATVTIASGGGGKAPVERLCAKSFCRGVREPHSCCTCIRWWPPVASAPRLLVESED